MSERGEPSETERAAARRVLRARRQRPQETRRPGLPLSLIVAVGVAAFLATGLALMALQEGALAP